MNSRISARIFNWVIRVFGPDCAHSTTERVTRHLEESIELAQAHHIPQPLVHNLVNHVYSRPVGNPRQELAGCILTLQAYAAAHNLSLLEVATEELDRIETLPYHPIRQKQKQKAEAGLSMKIDYP